MKVDRRTAGTLLVTAAIAVIGACAPGGDATPTATDTSGAGSPGPTSSAAVVTSPPVSTPTTSAAPLILTTPEAAAEHLHEAWKADDRSTALLGASAGAVDTLFTTTWESGTYFFGGCTQPVAPSDCQYNWAQGAVIMSIDGDSSAGFRVTAVSFTSAG